uniref:Phospholipase-like protein n=1 Tax=Tanacetum cinerariifolium TaxID=118510 RepID=A0A699GH04_TANCI|nr:phospholipase-like protein [Tanacetum cinerariifolium]
MTCDFHELLNIIFQDLIDPHDSDEDIANDHLVKEELRLCWEEEEMMRCFTIFYSMDTVWFTDDIQQFIGQPGKLKCKFPWSDDYIVDRNFCLRLVCLDSARKGWLSEEHIVLWVDYMWHGRPKNANWAMERLPVILEGAILLAKKGIHHSDYSISFKLVDNVSKQGGISEGNTFHHFSILVYLGFIYNLLPRIQTFLEFSSNRQKVPRYVKVPIHLSFHHKSPHHEPIGKVGGLTEFSKR